MICTCRELHLNSGRRSTGCFEWNPDCAEHGNKSEWWNSPEQVEKRVARDARRRDLQLQAREARRAAREAR